MEDHQPVPPSVWEKLREYGRLDDEVKRVEAELVAAKERREGVRQALLAWWAAQPPDCRPSSINLPEIGRIVFATNTSYRVEDPAVFERWCSTHGIEHRSFLSLSWQRVESYCRELFLNEGIVPQGVNYREYEVVKRTAV